MSSMSKQAVILGKYKVNRMILKAFKAYAKGKDDSYAPIEFNEIDGMEIHNETLCTLAIKVGKLWRQAQA